MSDEEKAELQFAMPRLVGVVAGVIAAGVALSSGWGLVALALGAIEGAAVSVMVDGIIDIIELTRDKAYGREVAKEGMSVGVSILVNIVRAGFAGVIAYWTLRIILR